MSSGDEQNIECPLCMEPLEMDDINFFPCTCGYQICRFCWHRIRTDENGLCPACRKQYPEDPADFKPLSVEELQRIKNEKKQKDLQRKQKIAENRKHLANVRVVQRNLVFVVGLPPRLAEAEVLKKHDYFGKFGKIHKVVVNHSTSYAGSQGPSASAYVTYYKAEDALRAIQTVNNFQLDGRTLRASLGTTKYCSHFLKNQQCPKPDCMYLHELGDEAASFTKEEMQQGKHQEYEKKLHEQILGVSHSSVSRKQASSPTGQLANSHVSQKEAWPSFQGKGEHKINGLTKNPHLQNPSSGKNETRSSSGNSKRNRHVPTEENYRGKAKERKDRNEKKNHHGHGHNNKVSKHNNKAHKTRAQSPTASSSNEQTQTTGGPPTQASHSCGSSAKKSQTTASGISSSSSSQSSCSSSCTSRTDTSSPTSSGSLSTVECIDDMQQIPEQNWTQREQLGDGQPQQQEKNSEENGKSMTSSESSLASSPRSSMNSDSPSPSLIEPPRQNLVTVQKLVDEHKESKSAIPAKVQPPVVTKCETFENGRVLEENIFNLVGEFPKQSSTSTLHHNHTDWLQNSDNAPLITSETIPVSSCTDWQAAFGFDSSQKHQDDDLGFDPWDECNKGLQDLLEKEATRKPCSTMGIKLNNPALTTVTANNTTAYNNIINSHNTNGSLGTESSQFPRRVAAPPPGFAPNHANPNPYVSMPNRSAYNNEISSNKMMHFMNMHQNQPLINNHLIMNTPVYREQHFPQTLPVVSNHKEPILSQGMNSMRPKGCDMYSSKDWQDELRALLPNVNISFGPPSQQLPNQVPQNQKGWSAHLSEMSGMTRDPAILSTGVLSDNHSGSPPHWMKSLQQLTVDEEPSSFKNRNITTYNTSAQFPYRAAQWASTALQSPPPGFGLPLNSSFRSSEPQAVGENL